MGRPVSALITSCASDSVERAVDELRTDVHAHDHRGRHEQVGACDKLTPGHVPVSRIPVDLTHEELVCRAPDQPRSQPDAAEVVVDLLVVDDAAAVDVEGLEEHT